MAKKLINVNVNGKQQEKAVEPRTLLIHFLREELNLTGAHIGCEPATAAPAPSTSMAARSRAARTWRCSATVRRC